MGLFNFHKLILMSQNKNKPQKRKVLKKQQKSPKDSNINNQKKVHKQSKVNQSNCLTEMEVEENKTSNKSIKFSEKIFRDDYMKKKY